MGSICMIYVKEKDLVVPGEILAEDDYYAGRGTFQENGKVCSNLLGLVSLRNKKISVIPLKSKYLPSEPITATMMTNVIALNPKVPGSPVRGCKNCAFCSIDVKHEYCQWKEAV